MKRSPLSADDASSFDRDFSTHFLDTSSKIRPMVLADTSIRHECWFWPMYAGFFMSAHIDRD